MSGVIYNGHVQHLVLTLPGQIPTIPSPPTLTPLQAGWVDASDLLLGEFAINIADGVVFQRVQAGIITIGGNSHFRGVFVSLVALQTAIPTANSGDYAVVDSGPGSSASQYIWDAQDGWVIGMGSGGVMSFNGRIGNVTPIAGDYTPSFIGAQPVNENLTELAAINFLLAGGEWVYNEGGVLVKKSSAQAKILLNKEITIVKSNINQSHTGNTTVTQLPFFITLDPAVMPITANTRFYLEITSSSNANANAKALGVWMNTVNNTLSGGQQIAHHSNLTVGAFSCNYSRTFILLNSLTSLKYMNIGVGSTGRDDIQNTVAMATSSAMNFANVVYFLFGVTLANASDSRSLDGIKLTISNPDFLL